MRAFSSFALTIALTASAFAVEPLPANPNLQPMKIHGLDWSADLASALKQAAKNKTLVFIDFTGESCINCKINDKNVFTKEEVADLFKRYERVQIYSDIVPAGYYKQPADEAKREKDGDANQGFQKANFKSEQLPLYVIVKPAEGGQFDIVGVYDEGRINKVDEFVKFLKKPLGLK